MAEPVVLDAQRAPGITSGRPQSCGLQMPVASGDRLPDLDFPRLSQSALGGKWLFTIKTLAYLKGSHGRPFSRLSGHADRLRALNARKPWVSLPAHTKHWLCDSTPQQIKSVYDVYEGIEDEFFIIYPGLFEHQSEVINALWRWVISNMAHRRGRAHTTKMWKSFCAHFKSVAIRSERPPPKVPRGTKYHDEKGCFRFPEEFHFHRRIVERGITTKDEASHVLHATSTRGLPAPQRSEWIDEVNSHGERITSSPVIDPGEFKKLDFLGSRLAAICVRNGKDRMTHSVAHLSLSNSASFDGSRRTGGRAASVADKFLRWVTGVPLVTSHKLTWFGQPYWEEATIPRFRTMCRTELLDRKEFIRSDDLGDNMPELDMLNIRYLNPVAGLDGKTGFQLLQWSIEEGIRLGSLKGKPYFDEEAPLQLGEILPAIRVSPIGEPGGKVRTITVDEDWVTLFLSPFGHETISWLDWHPSATAGLGAAAQAYEYAKSARAEVPKDFYFLTSDLTQASEMLVRPYTRTLLQSFCKGVGLKGPYYTTAIDLLCGSRLLDSCTIHGYEYTGCETTRGCLMGDPGTKAALTLTMLAAEEWAFRCFVLDDPYTEPPKVLWRHFVNAGDDHLACGPKPYLELIDQTLVKLGADLSIEKCFISQIGAFYSEEMVLNLSSIRWMAEKPLWDRPYAETPHVDSIKVRLLSPCEKQSPETQDESNPAIGKWKYLNRKLNWLPESLRYLVPVVQGRFIARFRHYVDWDDPMTYMPATFGGLDFPTDDMELVWGRLLDLHPAILDGMVQLMDKNCPYAIRSSIYSYRSNTTYRGRSLNDLLICQNKALFQMADDNITDEELRVKLEIPLEKWILVRHRDRARMAKKLGYLSLGEVTEMILRPTYFKEVLTEDNTRIEELDEYEIFTSLESIVDELLISAGISFEEFKVKFPDLYSELFAARLSLNEASWKIQTDSYKRILAGEHVERKIESSYQTTPWPERRRRMLKLLLYNNTCTAIAPHLTVASLQLLHDKVMVCKKDPTAQPAEYGDKVFIRANRVENLCSLATPLLR